MKFSFYQIAELVAGSDVQQVLADKRPWFVFETYWASDGPRTRICEGRYATREEAQQALDELASKS